MLRPIAESRLGSFGHRGNGRYREELRKGLLAIGRYLTASQLEASRTLLHIFGQYGTGTVLTDVAGLAFVTRGKDYSVLDHPLVQARLHLPADQVQQRPESRIVRSLYDCPDVPVGSEGLSCRVVVATHPAGNKKSPVGGTREGIVYELFFTKLPQQAFTASDVVELYLHRGAFEPALADEDAELDPDRWCSHSAWGQEAWQIISQWVWNEAPGGGTSVAHFTSPYHRICARSALSFTAHGSCLGLYSPTGGLGLESGSLLRSRLCSPARWDAALSR